MKMDRLKPLEEEHRELWEGMLRKIFSGPTVWSYKVLGIYSYRSVKRKFINLNTNTCGISSHLDSK